MTNSSRFHSTRRATPTGLPSAATQAGFTLVEVLVAMIVFAIGILSIATLMPMGARSVNRSGDQTRGSELASSCAEKLLSTGYSDSTLFSGAHTDPSSPYFGKYYVSWSVEDDQPVSQCKRATVSVAWPTAASAVGSTVVIVVPRSGS